MICYCLLQGVLASEGHCEFVTTIQKSYTPPASNINFQVTQDKKLAGDRQKIITEKLYDMVNAEVCAEQNVDPPPVDYTSTTHLDFSKEIEGTTLIRTIA